MDVTWGEAFRIGGVGFSTVFIVLGILVGALSLVGRVTRRISRGKDEANSAKKGG